MNLKKQITRAQRNLTNYLGWKTQRKLVIFESDDWGSIRMPSNQARKRLIQVGAVSSSDPYALYDSLESNRDIQQLTDILTTFRDKNDNYPIFTLNFILGNPDFEEIKRCNYEKYSFKPFYITYKEYPDHSEALDLIKFGIEKKVFESEFHGREHVNVERWLRHLKLQNTHANSAFNENCFFFKTESSLSQGKSIFAAFDLDRHNYATTIKNSLKEGFELFMDLFQKEPKSLIAPNYIWNENVEILAKDFGFSTIQGTKYQNLPVIGDSSYKRVYRYTGKQSSRGLYNTVRNCYFEPSSNLDRNKTVSVALKQIENAFYWNTPAIISTHRLNYLGYLNPKNRETNLELLSTLLGAILKKWPDVEFVSSTELANILDEKPEN